MQTINKILIIKLRDLMITRYICWASKLRKMEYNQIKEINIISYIKSSLWSVF